VGGWFEEQSLLSPTDSSLDFFGGDLLWHLEILEDNLVPCPLKDMVRLIKEDTFMIELGLLVINLLALAPLTHKATNVQLGVEDTMAGDRERCIRVEL